MPLLHKPSSGSWLKPVSRKWFRPVIFLHNTRVDNMLINVTVIQFFRGNNLEPRHTTLEPVLLLYLRLYPATFPPRRPIVKTA